MIYKKGDKYFIKVDDKARQLIEFIIDGESIFVDPSRTKKCECGVKIVWGINKENKIIELNKTPNWYIKHQKPYCTK